MSFNTIIRIAILAFIITFVGGFILYNYSQSEIPPQERIEELVNYADGIAYLRQGSNMTAVTDTIQGIKVETVFDEVGKKSSEAEFIIKIHDPDYKGTLEVVYPINRTKDGRLIIGVNFHKVKAYYFTKEIYIISFLVMYCISFFIIYRITALVRVKEQP